MADRFRALVIEERDGKPVSGFKDLTLSDLPDHDVLVEVLFSTLNYKDGLAISGKGRIARRLPMVAGVDLAGLVVSSRSPDWKPGDKVVVNGWGMSETEWGGYTRFQRLKPEWLTRLPDAFVGAGREGVVECDDSTDGWVQGHRPGCCIQAGLKIPHRSFKWHLDDFHACVRKCREKTLDAPPHRDRPVLRI